MSNLSDNLARILRREEGEVLHAYKDTRGILTIGIGRRIDEQGGISEQEALWLLMADVSKHIAGVRQDYPWASTLDDVRFGALVLLRFQLGGAGLAEFVKMLAAVRDGHYADAATELRTSLFAEQVPDRAKRVAYQIEVGEWQ